MKVGTERKPICESADLQFELSYSRFRTITPLVQHAPISQPAWNGVGGEVEGDPGSAQLLPRSGSL
jgi:hypothetical protein